MMMEVIALRIVLLFIRVVSKETVLLSTNNSHWYDIHSYHNYGRVISLSSPPLSSEFPPSPHSLSGTECMLAITCCLQMQDMYYRKVIDLYELVNGASESCKTRARACGNRTAAADTDHDDASPPLPLPTYTPALNEKIHLSLMQLGLTNTKGTTVIIFHRIHSDKFELLLYYIILQINPSALKDVFGANVYMGCMSSGQGGLGQYILTRVAFCFRCSGTNPHQPCDEIQLADCWTDAKNPPSTVPWADTYGDVPCYTGKKQVCYCGFNRMAYCSC